MIDHQLNIFMTCLNSKKFTHNKFNWALFLVIFFVCGACSSGDFWGSAEYFRNITGVPIENPELILECSRDSFPDVYQVRVVRLPEEMEGLFPYPGPTFKEYPKQSKSDKHNKFLVKQWSSEVPNEKVKKKIKMLLMDLSSLGSGKCDREDLKIKYLNLIANRIGKRSTHYAYQYITSGNEIKIRKFYFIDGETGCYIEIIK